MRSSGNRNLGDHGGGFSSSWLHCSRFRNSSRRICGRVWGHRGRDRRFGCCVRASCGCFTARVGSLRNHRCCRHDERSAGGNIGSNRGERRALTADEKRGRTEHEWLDKHIYHFFKLLGRVHVRKALMISILLCHAKLEIF